MMDRDELVALWSVVWRFVALLFAPALIAAALKAPR